MEEVIIVAKLELVGTNISYELGRFVFLSSRDIHAFHIRVSPEALLISGILVKILQVFSSKAIPLVHIKLSRPAIDHPIEILVFVDLTNKRQLLNSIMNELKELDMIQHVEYIAPIFEGFVAYNGLFPLTIFNERAIILRKPLYEAFVKLLREELGSGYTAWLYQLGVEMGRNAYKSHKEVIQSEDVDKIVKFAEALFTQIGFGKLRVRSLDIESKRALVRVYNSFECELFKGSNTPSSYLIKGMLKGWFSCLFKADIKINEIKCIAKGDPYCEFEIKSEA